MRRNTHDPKASERKAKAAFTKARALAKQAEREIMKRSGGDQAKVARLALEAAYQAGVADTHASYAGMRKPNGYGWGAFLGSLAGVILGGPLGMAGRLAGSVAGGFFGGKYGLPPKKPSQKGAMWGAVGGILGPIGAGIAARAGTDSGRSPNPKSRARALMK
jgi:hypothetical protein